MDSKQTQVAGSESNQLQIGTLNVYNGITENRAREIVREQIPEIINTYTQEARNVAEERIEQFEEILIPKLVKQNLLETLGDPSIQFLLKDSQKAAVCTNRIIDYGLLSELLIYRVKRGEDRVVSTGVSHAVRIVDEISDEALLGLTVAHAIASFTPVSYDLTIALKTLDDLFSKVIYAPLPQGNQWLDQLDVLGAIRLELVGRLKKLEVFYSENMSSFVDVGIRKNSSAHSEAVDLIQKAGIPLTILVDHELRDGYVRLKTTDFGRLEKNENLVASRLLGVNYPTQEQIQTVKNIYALYEDDHSLKNENVMRFANQLDSFVNLKRIREWWNSLDSSFTITCVGKVLAHANAQRCDSTLPPLD